MTDAETGQRGFLLTGDENYIAPYTRARAAIAGEIATTRALVAGDHEQERRLGALDQLCAHKMTELAQTIALRRQGDTAGALEIVRTDRGMELMQDIRNVAAEMTVEERRTLAIIQLKSLSAARVSSLVTLGGAALVLALIVAAALRTSRDYRARQIQAWIRAGQVGLSERIHGGQRPKSWPTGRLDFWPSILGARAGVVYLAEPDGTFPALSRLRRFRYVLMSLCRKPQRRILRTELLVAPASVDGVVYAVVVGFLSPLGSRRPRTAVARVRVARRSRALVKKPGPAGRAARGNPAARCGAAEPDRKSCA
jgi:CHASE3 domain sensor protein